MNDILLHTDQLTVGYHGEALIRDITFSVRAGQILTLIGPNGAGKSTILKSISRQLAPLAGTVFLQGKVLTELPRQQLAQTMSILMTQRLETEWMRCIDVVESGRYPYTGRLGILSDDDRNIAQEALRLVHGEALAQRDFRQLSDGQRQRILLAKAICQEPEVLILDEPTSFLDIRYQLELLQILKELVHTRSIAVVLSLHELDLAQKLSDLVACVHGDRIERIGTPDEIFTGDYIASLYEMTCGSYDSYAGTPELPPPAGVPRTFVIGGGGAGIPVYRQLQREGVPFYAGVLPENDLDFPTARALAAEVISEAAFEPVGEAAFQRAAQRMAQCETVICCCTAFGTMNRRNQDLLELAREQGKHVE